MKQITSLAQPVIKIACAGETLAGYKCQQRGECAMHGALKNNPETIDFRPIFRDEITGYCARFCAAA